MQTYHRVVSVLLVLFSLVVVGIIGYMSLESMSLLDALYMTIITISTVGFSEVQKLTSAGRIFTILFILISLSTVAYAFTSITSFILEGELNKLLRRRKMESKVAKLSDHFILCGYGQTGQIIVEQFLEKGVPFIVIEKDESKVQSLQEQGVLAVKGDASTEEELKNAQIDQSKGLISCLASDADNLFTVLTARGMKSDLYIVARAIDRSSHAKLRKAGANNTISPNELGGTRMAALVLKPAVVSFIDLITRVGDVDFDIEEVFVHKGSSLVNQSLKDTQIREKTGFIVLAVQSQGEKHIRFNPGYNELINEGDKLIVLGETQKMDALRALAQKS